MPDPRSATTRIAVVVVLAAGGLLAGVAGGMAVQPWRYWQSDPPTPTALTVEMRGRDYRWWFRHPGPDGELGTPDDIEAGHDLRVPAGARVELLVRSDDYVYALVIPDYGQRQIAVPGQTNTLTIQASAPGSHEILADPMCSVRGFHDERMGRILVQSPRDYLAWEKTP